MFVCIGVILPVNFFSYIDIWIFLNFHSQSGKRLHLGSFLKNEKFILNVSLNVKIELSGFTNPHSNNNGEMHNAYPKRDYLECIHFEFP